MHSSILAWRIPWTEEPGGLQSKGCRESEHLSTLQPHGPLLRRLGFDFWFLSCLQPMLPVWRDSRTS